MAACGIAPEDDDGNAASRKTEIKKSEVDESVMVDHLAAIEATTTEDDLKKAYVKAYAYANGEPTWQKRLLPPKTNERKTVMEQRSPEWFAARLGKVTASKVADVIAKTKTGYSASRETTWRNWYASA